jgi:hypothetical protein
MPCTPARLHRRTLLLSAAAAVAAPQVVRAAANATPLPPMTEGPFYPRPDWRAPTAQTAQLPREGNLRWQCRHVLLVPA